MNKFIKIVLTPIKWVFLIPIYIYKATISKLLPDVCIYQPTCSTYTIIAIKRFGILRGIFMGFRRICRCHPKSSGGLDPVPDNIKGNIKYLI